MRVPLSLFAVLLAASALLPGLVNAGEGEVPDFARDVPQVRSGEPILRFNGKDLSGFYTHTRGHGYEDPKKVFTVHDGMLHISGEEYGGGGAGGHLRRYSPSCARKGGAKTWGPAKERSGGSGVLAPPVGARG